MKGETGRQRDPNTNLEQDICIHIFTVSSAMVGVCLRSEEHTSELQSHHDLVCRLLLEKKNEATTSKFHAPRRRSAGGCQHLEWRPTRCNNSSLSCVRARTDRSCVEKSGRIAELPILHT